MTTAVALLPEQRRAIWELYIDSTDEPTKEGWHMGWCPRCTPLTTRRRKPSTWTAEVNIRESRFRCIGPDACTGVTGKGERERPKVVAIREAEAWAQGYDSHADVPRQERKAKPNPVGEKVRVELQQRHPDHDQLLPSPFWAGVFGMYINKKVAPKDGSWSGWCPIHDPQREGKATALFNFRSGFYKCLGEPPCHEHKRAMSLANLRLRVEATSGAK